MALAIDECKTIECLARFRRGVLEKLCTHFARQPGRGILLPCSSCCSCSSAAYLTVGRGKSLSRHKKHLKQQKFNTLLKCQMKHVIYHALAVWHLQLPAPARRATPLSATHTQGRYLCERECIYPVCSRSLICFNKRYTSSKYVYAARAARNIPLCPTLPLPLGISFGEQQQQQQPVLARTRCRCRCR